MRKARQFADREEQQQPIEPARPAGACCAHNCPLPGTITSSTSGGNFHCWAHDRLEEASQWPYMTQGINNKMHLFRLAEKIQCMSLYNLEQKSKEIDSYLRGSGLESLCRMKNNGEFSDRCAVEPRSSWVSRIRNHAYKAAFEYVDSNWRKAA